MSKVLEDIKTRLVELESKIDGIYESLEIEDDTAAINDYVHPGYPDCGCDEPCGDDDCAEHVEQ